jgi:hypothetical protein
MKIISVVGARPNFMKIAPFIKSIHEVNSASVPPSGGNPGVGPVGEQAEGVKSIHEVNTASSPKNKFNPFFSPNKGEMSAYGHSAADKEGIRGDASSLSGSRRIRPQGGPAEGVKKQQSNLQTLEHLLVHTGQHYDDRGKLITKAAF